MAVSPITLIQEDTRELEARDDKYYKYLLFFFEMLVPPRLTPGGINQFFFPLVVNPESYSLSEPFTVDTTPTQGGGLYVEENGIVQRTIKLRGHTGFFPKRLPNTTTTPLTALAPDTGKSHGRKLQPLVLWKLSGQRHFHYLQDAIFRTYADLKRDPSAAEETLLLFHNQKDEESWVVVPMKFDLTRTAGERVLYSYDIELLVVDYAESARKDFSEDMAILDVIKTPFRMIQSGVDLATGALNDLTGVAAHLEGTIKNFNRIFDGVGTILSAASDFVDGVTDLIEAPYSTVASLSNLIDEAMSLRYNAEESVTGISRLPDTIVNKFRQLEDGLDRIGTHPEAFVVNLETKIQETVRRTEVLKSISQLSINQIEETSPPDTLAEYNTLGTEPTAGDLRSARSELGVGRSFPHYTGSTARPITKGDTLVNLAARYLGDARLWTHIAAVNGLQPPFLTDQASGDLTADDSPFRGALAVGSDILIPNFNRPPQDLPVLPVLGVRAEESAEVHLMGTDLALVAVGGRAGARLYDLAVDTEGGSTGPKLIRGRDNLGQALLMRIRTERGTDTLYSQVGLGPVIGTSVKPVDVEMARFKIIESLTQDPRVANVRSVEFESSNADALETDIEVEVRGLTVTNNIKVTV